jgi:hypothetical protein
VGVNREFIPLDFIPSREGRGYCLEFARKILRMKDVRIYAFPGALRGKGGPLACIRRGDS